MALNRATAASRYNQSLGILCCTAQQHSITNQKQIPAPPEFSLSFWPIFTRPFHHGLNPFYSYSQRSCASFDLFSRPHALLRYSAVISYGPPFQITGHQSACLIRCHQNMRTATIHYNSARLKQSFRSLALQQCSYHKSCVSFTKVRTCGNLKGGTQK